MPHHMPLVATIVSGLVVAFVFGAIAHRLRISPIAGYLLAGVAVGPFTPGFVAHSELANELAEIGVILLMFGVGLHFSLRDLLSVRRIAVPGAIGQILVAVLLGMGLAHLFGWNPLAGFVFGLALSVASTVVLLRAMQSLDLVETQRGKIAVGWLIVEDLAMVLALVLLPALARSANGDGGMEDVLVALGATLLKVGGFLALIFILCRPLIPRILHWVAHSGSRELFRLAVLAIALGVAFGATHFFGVSLALGAFFAGMILGETPLSRRATEETLPLRDAFAVLFFVSVGMLFNPQVVVEQPWGVVATVLIIILGKSIAAYAIVRAFGHDSHKAITIAASLAQIGEFSFILATLGTSLDILPEEGRDLILAGAMISIFLNPFLFALVPQREPEDEEAGGEDEAPPGPPRRDHWILVGYGRVGSLIAASIRDASGSLVIVESEKDMADQAREAGFDAQGGNAVEPRALKAAGIDHADVLLIAIPESYEAGAIIERARELKPGLKIIARAHSLGESEHLEKLGADCVVMGEREIARRMAALCAE